MMKKLITTVCVLGCLSLTAQAQPTEAARSQMSEAPGTTVRLPKQKMIDRLTDLMARGYMFGHQDDPFYGLTWSGIEDPARPERGRSDTRESCGDYPAVMGFDLGGIEVGDEKNLDSVPFTRIREELLAHVERGGIVTLSWHPRNPLTGGTAWDNNDSTVVSSILPGGTQHRKFLLWMKNVRNFLQTLKTDDGHPVPIIFRPWHENNGGWFWWGAKQCTPQEYRALWCMLQDYLISEGLDNLLWSYSPNLGICDEAAKNEELRVKNEELSHARNEELRVKNEEYKLPESSEGNPYSSFRAEGAILHSSFGAESAYFLSRYPGDDRVDLLGLDAYQWGTEQDFVRQLNADMTFLTHFAEHHGRLFALTECGLKNLPDPTWWTRVLKPQIDKYPICYFLVWRNAKHEFFGPAPGEKNAVYFNEMIRNKNVLMLKDIAK